MRDKSFIETIEPNAALSLTEQINHASVCHNISAQLDSNDMLIAMINAYTTEKYKNSGDYHTIKSDVLNITGMHEEFFEKIKDKLSFSYLENFHEVLEAVHSSYKAIDYAKYIITQCTKENNLINNLELQNLLFLSQIQSLRKNRILFSDQFEAWNFGPVIPYVYDYFCGYGSMDIRYNFDISIPDEDKFIIDHVISKYQHMLFWEVKDIVNAPGGSWDTVYRSGTGLKEKIPVELMYSLDAYKKEPIKEIVDSLVK